MFSSKKAMNSAILYNVFQCYLERVPLVTDFWSVVIGRIRRIIILSFKCIEVLGSVQFNI